jgi:hypothetical protein
MHYYQGEQINVTVSGGDSYQLDDIEFGVVIYPVDDPTSSHYEEIEESDIPRVEYPAPSYEQLVQSYIRERYSVDEELALNRQRNTKVDEFKAYFDFCESCKVRAKAETTKN